MPEAALRIVSHSWEFWISDLKCWSSFAGAVVILVKCARAGKVGWKRWFRGSSRFEAHYFTLHDIRNPKYKQKEAFAIIFFLFRAVRLEICVYVTRMCLELKLADILSSLTWRTWNKWWAKIPGGIVPFLMENVNCKKKPSNSLLQNPRFRCDLAQQQLYYIPQQ